jgi:hypothetical protein
MSCRQQSFSNRGPLSLLRLFVFCSNSGTCPRRLLAFALKFEGRKRKHDADEYMAKMAAERRAPSRRAGFVVMKKPPLGGHSAIEG